MGIGSVRKRTVAVLATGVAVGLVGSTAAVAAVSIHDPAADGRVYACYSTSTGALHLINKGRGCARGYAHISWVGTLPNPVTHDVAASAFADGAGRFTGRGYGVPSYTRALDATVRLSGAACIHNVTGTCETGGGNEPAGRVVALFQLPVGYRPGTTQQFVVQTYTVSSGVPSWRPAGLQVTSDGWVSVFSDGSPGAGEAFISLASVEFRAGI